MAALAVNAGKLTTVDDTLPIATASLAEELFAEAVHSDVIPSGTSMNASFGSTAATYLNNIWPPATVSGWDQTGSGYTWTAATGAAATTISAGQYFDYKGNLVVNLTPSVNYTVSVASDGQAVKWIIATETNKKALAKERFRRQLTSDERRVRSYLANLQTVEEQKARATLRDLITEADWRRYLTNGFVMVKAPSKRWYQIFADQRHTLVYESGKKIASLCIHSVKDCPPTDHVLNLKFLVEFDEGAMWAGANVSRYSYDHLTMDQQAVINAGLATIYTINDPIVVGA